MKKFLIVLISTFILIFMSILFAKRDNHNNENINITVSDTTLTSRTYTIF